MPAEAPRVKPSKRPRYRYVLVRFAGLSRQTQRHEVIAALRAVDVDGESPWLTRFSGEYGILRISRGREARLRQRLAKPVRFPPDNRTLRVETLLTSGSIAGLDRHHGSARLAR